MMVLGFRVDTNRDDGLGRGSSGFLCFIGNFGGGINLMWQKGSVGCVYDFVG